MNCRLFIPVTLSNIMSVTALRDVLVGSVLFSQPLPFSSSCGFSSPTHHPACSSLSWPLKGGLEGLRVMVMGSYTFVRVTSLMFLLHLLTASLKQATPAGEYRHICSRPARFQLYNIWLTLTYTSSSIYSFSCIGSAGCLHTSCFPFAAWHLKGGEHSSKNHFKYKNLESWWVLAPHTQLML